MLGNAIYSILSTDATLTAIVGTKIYPSQAPQRTSQPFIVYTENNTEPTDHKDGVAPIDQKQLQVDVYSTSYTQAHTIGARIRVLLDNYSDTAASVTIIRMWFTDQDDGDFIEDLGFYGVSQLYEAKIQR